MNRNVQIAVLLHVIPWQYNEDNYEIAPNILLCKTSDSLIDKLYKKMCADEGLDDGSPYDYYSHILFSPADLNKHFGWKGSPHELLDRLLNVVAIFLSEPINHVRIIHSEDNFSSYSKTSLEYLYGEQTDFIQLQSCQGLDEGLLNKVKKAWNIIEDLWGKEKVFGRLNSALTYFYYAWNSHYIDQVCINLAITLEILFTPNSNMELSHQLSCNVAKFMSSEIKEREYFYHKIKKFYSVRSQLIHGMLPDDMKIIDITVDTFHFVSSILSNILSSKESSELFNNNKKRIEFFNDILFK